MSEAINLFLPGSWDIRQCREFKRGVKVRLMTLSRSQRGTSLAHCMFPSCEVSEPPDILEVHHIRAKHYGGGSDEDNAILFCRMHHNWAHCFLFPAEYCIAFRECQLPEGVTEWLNRPLEKMWDTICALSEFSKAPQSLDYRSRLETLSQIRYAASYHPEREKNVDMWGLVMGWSASVQAAMLTSLVPGRVPYSPSKSHPRNVISSLVQESLRYLDYARDDFLLVHNDHISAVNYNAFLQIDSSVRKMKDCQAVFKRLSSCHMPINNPEYRTYILSNSAAIFAKAGETQALDLAKESILLSREGNPNHLPEAYARQLEAAMLLGERDIAKAAASALIKKLPEADPSPKLIGLKMLAGYFLCLEAYPEAKRFCEEALNVARHQFRAHSENKILNILKAIETTKHWRHHWAFSLRASGVKRPSLRLAALL